ncbi:MAG: DUF2059 domain-containing protein [Verrucomicrobiota bacterium]
MNVGRKPVGSKKISWILTCLACFFGYVWMVQWLRPDNEESAFVEARRLMEAMHAEQSYAKAWEEFTEELDLEENALGLSEDEIGELWKAVFERMVEIYAEVYTREELRGIRKFFESDAGKGFLSKKDDLAERYFDLYWELLDMVVEERVKNEELKG